MGPPGGLNSQTYARRATSSPQSQSGSPLQHWVLWWLLRGLTVLVSCDALLATCWSLQLWPSTVPCDLSSLMDLRGVSDLFHFF